MKSHIEIAKKATKLVKQNKILVATLATGAVVGAYIDDSFEKNRYPVRLEYQIISECVGQSYSSRNVNPCICALEKTMSEISYEDRTSKPFSRTFEYYLRRCT